jgi:hypothetical protein
MLLYDTQAHLEKFATRVERLVSSVENARMETIEAKDLIQGGHGKLTGEIVDLGTYMRRLRISNCP